MKVKLFAAIAAAMCAHGLSAGEYQTVKISNVDEELAKYTAATNGMAKHKIRFVKHNIVRPDGETTALKAPDDRRNPRLQFPVEIRRAGEYSFWVRHWRAENMRTALEFLLRAPNGECVNYTLVDRFEDMWIDKDAEGRNQFKRELRETVCQLRSVPSVVIWELFDEGRGQFDSQNLGEYVMDLDGSRLIDYASGGVDMGYGDICSVHSSGTKWKYKPDGKKRHVLLSACGYLGSRAEGHCWSGKSVAAVRFDSPQRLSFAIQELYDESIRPAEEQGLMGCIYYQLTDVENEISGFLSYDRVRCKIAPSELRRLITVSPTNE